MDFGHSMMRHLEQMVNGSIEGCDPVLGFCSSYFEDLPGCRLSFNHFQNINKS